MWKIATELLAIAPFAALFLAAFAYETTQAVAKARALRRAKATGGAL